MKNEKAIAKLPVGEQILIRHLLKVMNCPEMSEDDISDKGQRAFMDAADYLATKGIVT